MAQGSVSDSDPVSIPGDLPVVVSNRLERDPSAPSPQLQIPQGTMSAMLVSGLTGRAKIANGTYRVVPGELQHRRPVYRQADV